MQQNPKIDLIPRYMQEEWDLYIRIPLPNVAVVSFFLPFIFVSGEHQM
nr:hypothetical protein [Bacillus wiedmannii]